MKLHCISLLLILCIRNANSQSYHISKTQLAVTLYVECLNKYKADLSKFLKVNPRCNFKMDEEQYGCWPFQHPNKTSTISCPPYRFKGGNATYTCNENGTYVNLNFSMCEKLTTKEIEHNFDVLSVSYGYTTWKELNRYYDRESTFASSKKLRFILRVIDAVVCFIAFFSMLYLIPLKKPRIMIHRNLVLAFMLNDIVQAAIMHEEMDDQNEICSYLSVVSHYFTLAQLSWMFGEGFYQFRRFYFVFFTKQYIWAYFIFGWGLPFITVFVIYLPIMLKDPPAENFQICWENASGYKYNYLVYSQFLILLVLNICIVTYLMWVVWTKLRTTPDHELVKSRKAARGFIILLILLGGAYVFTFYGPPQYIPFIYISSIVVPIQGALVCTFHVFLSREVRNAAVNVKLRRLSTHLSNSHKTSKTDSITASDYFSSRRSSLFNAISRRTSLAGSRRGSDVAPESSSVFGNGYSLRNLESQIPPAHQQRHPLNGALSVLGNDTLHPIGEETPTLSTKSISDVETNYNNRLMKNGTGRNNGHKVNKSTIPNGKINNTDLFPKPLMDFNSNVHERFSVQKEDKPTEDTEDKQDNDSFMSSASNNESHSNVGSSLDYPINERTNDIGLDNPFFEQTNDIGLDNPIYKDGLFEKPNIFEVPEDLQLSKDTAPKPTKVSVTSSDLEKYDNSEKA